MQTISEIGHPDDQIAASEASLTEIQLCEARTALVPRARAVQEAATLL